MTAARTTGTTIGIAVDIPQPWGDLLTTRRAAAGDRAAEHVRAHVTLLGPTQIEASALPAIESGLDALAAGYPPFRIHLRGTGTFRPITDVVFVTIAAGISDCERLHDAILALPGIDRDRRFPYHPHVTVAHDVSAEQLDAVFADLAGFEAEFVVGGFTLFDHDEGGRWQRRKEYRLDGRRTR